jgi:hypothetical protein
VFVVSKEVRIELERMRTFELERHLESIMSALAMSFFEATAQHKSASFNTHMQVVKNVAPLLVAL